MSLILLVNSVFVILTANAPNRALGLLPIIIGFGLFNALQNPIAILLTGFMLLLPAKNTAHHPDKDREYSRKCPFSSSPFLSKRMPIFSATRREAIFPSSIRQISRFKPRVLWA